jgi:type II secretory pathway component GspD/PulD (secretin)
MAIIGIASNRGGGFAAAVTVLITICIGGCGDIFAQKPTEIQSRRIREDVRRIRTVADANIVMPQFYRAPPKIVTQTVAGAEEFKLFYFCRHHTSTELAQIVKDQFATKLFDKKGKSTTQPDYTVSSNPATNQLIVRCPSKDDVSAVLELLEFVDVAPIQVKIDCLISEVYADKTLDRETTVEIFDLLGEDVTAGGSGRLFGKDVLELIQEAAPLPAFPGASLREIARAKMGLKVGYASTEHDFLAVVDLLESKGYLKILMNPTLEVVNGQKAKIQSSEKVPLEKIFLRDRDGFVETKTEYVDVIDALEIVPHVFADGYIGLETTALIGSKNIPEGVKQIRIVSKREIYNKENRIRQGESLVIGGIRKSEEHSVVRGVPFLKDIPGLNILFSSKDYEERAIETIFILTPTISTGGIPNKEMVQSLRRKHQRPTLQDDLFGLEERKRRHERQLQDLEQEQRLAQAEKAKARDTVRHADEEIQRANARAERAIAETQRAKTEAKQAKAETEKIKAMLEDLSKTIKELEPQAETAKK